MLLNSHKPIERKILASSSTVIWKPYEVVFYVVERRRKKVLKSSIVYKKTVTENNFPSSHQKVFNRSIFVKIDLEPATLLKINILMYFSRS